MTSNPIGPGRPRHTGSRAPKGLAREEILQGSAELFVNRGFAAASTRHIAEKVGLRQSTIYYYFPAGKEGILAELLQRSVRPSLEKVEKIELECPDDVPEAALYLLALIDVGTLARVPHNIGSLYRMPDVRSSVVFEEFQPALRELSTAYGDLGVKIASASVASSISRNQLSVVLLQAVEEATRIRAAGDTVTATNAHTIASACLRVCGVPQVSIVRAADTAAELVPAIGEERLA